MKKEQETENNKTEEKKGDMRKEVVSWVRMFVIVIAVVFVLTQFVIINVRVPSGSMENTIMTKDRLIGFRFSYWFDEPQRGDIILFSYPVDEKQTYIKRVIGLPGETVEIRDGKIYIDGSSEPLEEDYLKETWTWENDGYTFKVPEGCYFVLGDNMKRFGRRSFLGTDRVKRGKSSTPEEAEPYSYVKKDEIKGKAIFKYYSNSRY